MIAGGPPILWVLGAAVLVCASPAKAQLSGSLALDSDYRLRGYSLTHQRPAASFTVNYDHSSGLYAGGSIIGENNADSGPRLLGHTEYLGFARGKPGGLTWDVGVSTLDMTVYRDRRYSIDYTQVYLGLAAENLSGHVYLQPNYPRKGVSTSYAELNGVLRPAENWRLTAHGGIGRRLGGSNAQDGRAMRYDVRLGVVRQFGSAEVRAAWTAALHRPRFGPTDGRGGFSVGASLFF